MPTFPHQKAEKPPFQQHDLSILIVGPNQLKHRLSRTRKPKSHPSSNTQCPITPAPNAVRSPSLAGGRALRRPEHPWGHKQRHIAHGNTTRHVGITKPPGPNWGRAAVAVALGFEPRVAVTPHSISSAAPSAARTRYHTRILYYTNPPTTQIDHPRWEQSHTPKPRVRAPTRTSRYAIASNSPRPPRPPRTSESPGKD